jgi:hypothetical protein
LDTGHWTLTVHSLPYTRPRAERVILRARTMVAPAGSARKPRGGSTSAVGRPQRAARAGAAGKDETLQGSDHRSNRPAPRPRSCRDRSRDVPCFGGCGRGPEGASPAGAGGSPVQTVLSAPVPAAGPDDHGAGRVRVALADRSPSPPLVPQTAGIGRDSRRRRTGASAAGTLRRARTSAQKTKKARADARAPDPSTEGDYADLRLPADSLPLLRSVSSS